MSVLKAKRRESKAEFVNIADQIFTETLWFLARMSFRYQRLLAEDAMRLASEVLDHCEKAQNIRLSAERVNYEARLAHLLEARASVMALDVHLSHIWSILMLNPQGCFTNTKGVMKSAADCTKILDKVAEDLGEKIDKEKNMLTALLESDKKRYRELSGEQ